MLEFINYFQEITFLQPVCEASATPMFQRTSHFKTLVHDSLVDAHQSLHEKAVRHGYRTLCLSRWLFSYSCRRCHWMSAECATASLRSKRMKARKVVPIVTCLATAHFTGLGVSAQGKSRPTQAICTSKTACQPHASVQ